jgi:DNA recombination protein RmuC
MTSTTLLILVAFVALLLGGLIGWLVGGRRSATLDALLREQTEDLTQAQADGKLIQAKFETAIRELAQQSDRAAQADSLRVALDTARSEKSALNSQLAALAATSEARAQSVAEQMAQLTSLRADTEVKFAELAQTALNAGAKNFLTLANETFEKHALGSAAQLDQKRLELDGLLTPLKETLTRYETKLVEVEKERADAYGGLRELVTEMKAGHAKVSDQTNRLANALRGSAKMRGNWGEQQLRNVLEKAGLSALSDFRTEVSVDTEDGRLRPDVVVRLPGGHELVIDAKVSLAAYQASTETDDDTEKLAHMSGHAKAMRLRAKDLGSKAYMDQFSSPVDLVIMFVPGEHFVNAAMEVDPELWEYAFSRGVLIASPTNLIALARTVAQSWNQARMNDDAAKIAELAKDLFKRLAVMGDKVVTVGKRLQLAVDGYNEFVGSLEGSVMPQARKFRDMEIGTSEKPMVELESLAVHVRQPVPGRDLLLSAEPNEH